MITAASSTDTAIREFAHLTLKLRDDLTFSFGSYDERDCYVVEDPMQSRFYRIGVAEYRFISCFDGKRTVGDIIGDAARELGRDALSEQDSIVVVNWLLDTQLAVSRGSYRTSRLMKDEDKRRDAALVKSVNLMFLKVPLMNPNRFLGLALVPLSWMFSAWAGLLWFAVVLSGLWLVLSDWDNFMASSAAVFSADNWLQIILLWSLLKIVHEIAHGIVCKRYGADVLESGVIFVLFAPIGYVDATAAWRFGSKWQRIHTAAAGMYVEFFIAGIAAWVWATSADPYQAQIAQNLVLIASVNTLLFNANPLMKFDGYYIFSDWLEIPNLYGRGQDFVKYASMRLMLGLPATPPGDNTRETMICGVYGVLSLLWRVVVVATLLIVAQTLFKGAGAAVAAVSAVILIGLPMVKFFKFLFFGNHQHSPKLVRFAASLAIIALTGWFVLDGLRVAPRISAPAVVDFKKVEYLRADSSGFVAEVSVQDGELVTAGDVVVRLENRELEMRIREFEIQIESLEYRRRARLHAGDIAAAQGDAREIETARKALAEHQGLAAAMIVHAVKGGRVLGRNVESLKGRYVERGDTLMALANNTAQEIRASIAQDDVASFRQRIGETVQLRLQGHGATPLLARLESIDPRASDRVEHEAVTALAGGKIKVRAQADQDGYRYTDPRFSARIQLLEESTVETRAGQTATVSILAEHESVGVLWYRQVSQWVKQTIAVARGAADAA